jgi:thiol:disulfide interchange protein DsbD
MVKTTTLWQKLFTVLGLLAWAGVASAADSSVSATSPLPVPAAASAALSDLATTDQVRAQLLSSSPTVRPGERITIGLQQKIIPHWHTYWQNAGDSGSPTTIAWHLPAGANAGPIQWPVPKYFDIGPVTNYGYADEVTLLSELTVPANAPVGGSFPIKATVNWLVCNDICIPQTVEMGLTLPVAAASNAAPPAAIAQAQSQLPVASPWPASVVADKEGFSLRIANAKLADANVREVWFYPTQWGKVSHSARQPRRVDGDATLLQLQAGDAPLQAGEALSGVLVVTTDGAKGIERRGYTIAPVAPPGFKVVSAPAPAPAAAPSLLLPEDTSPVGLPAALLLALVGGLILNLMPCVFPVLSIKALSLLQHSQQSPRQARLQGLVYTAGVLASLGVLAGVLIALKAGGAQIGWGFQFQSPVFVLAVAYLMFVVGLNLSGVFEFGESVTGVGSSLADKQGLAGSFFTGVLATVVATPCTAPFMGAAIGFALSQPALPLLAVFMALGLGLALPYLALSWWPALQRWLPRPGLWMLRVKQVLAFPMYAAAVWLVWVLAQQTGADAVAVALGGMVVIAFAAWLYQASRSGSLRMQRGGLVVALLVLVVTLGASYRATLDAASDHPESTTATSGQKDWQPYTADRLQALRAQGTPVFVNMTAAWCITCLANEKVALSSSAVIAAFKQADITYLKGDWTHQDPQITQLLKDFKRSGVPLYVFYPAGRNTQPVVLPQLLTPDIVLGALSTKAVQAVSASSEESPTRKE